MILSVSRRTDVPAWYTDWLLTRLTAGYVCVRNPFHHSQVRKIALNPRDVEAIVFWTKNAIPLSCRLTEVEQLGFEQYCFLYTITPYGRDIEALGTKKTDIIDNFVAISERIGKEKMVWRYDPILVTDKYDVEFHFRSFEGLCRHLHGHCHLVIISFVDVYRKMDRRIQSVNRETKKKLSQGLSEMAKSYGLAIQSCCEEAEVRAYIPAGACISRALIEATVKGRIRPSKAKGQRKGCQCLESVDIGAYHTCLSRCGYCYATDFHRRRSYNPESPLLCDMLSDSDLVREKQMPLLVERQRTLDDELC